MGQVTQPSTEGSSSLRIVFNPTRSTSPCYNPTHACNIQWYT